MISKRKKERKKERKKKERRSAERETEKMAMVLFQGEKVDLRPTL